MLQLPQHDTCRSAPLKHGGVTTALSWVPTPTTAGLNGPASAPASGMGLWHRHLGCWHRTEPDVTMYVAQHQVLCHARYNSGERAPQGRDRACYLGSLRLHQPPPSCRAPNAKPEVVLLHGVPGFAGVRILTRRRFRVHRLPERSQAQHGRHGPSLASTDAGHGRALHPVLPSSREERGLQHDLVCLSWNPQQVPPWR